MKAIDPTSEYPVRIGGPNDRARSNRHGVIAPSQVYQELPIRDRHEWVRDITEAPETVDERAARTARELGRTGFGPESLAWAADWARRRLAALALGIVPALVAGGCAPLGLLAGDPAPTPEKVVCVAHYHRVLPGVDVGATCGNLWLKETARDGTQRCLFESEPGIVIEIQCPAEGDTLAVQP